MRGRGFTIRDKQAGSGAGFSERVQRRVDCAIPEGLAFDDHVVARPSRSQQVRLALQCVAFFDGKRRVRVVVRVAGKRVEDAGDVGLSVIL